MAGTCEPDAQLPEQVGGSQLGIGQPLRETANFGTPTQPPPQPCRFTTAVLLVSP